MAHGVGLGALCTGAIVLAESALLSGITLLSGAALVNLSGLLIRVLFECHGDLAELWNARNCLTWGFEPIRFD